MTLDQVKKMYESAMDKRILDGSAYHLPYATDAYWRKMMIFPEETHTAMSMQDDFSLMFWRLYPDGSVTSGLDFSVFHAARPTDPWYCRLGSTEAHMHRHNYIEISYVYSGTLCQNINGRDCKHHEGDVWILDRNCLHSEYMLGHDCFVVFLEINVEFFDEMFREAFRSNPAGGFIREALVEKRDQNRFIHFSADHPSPEVERIFNYILEERERDLPGSSYVIKGLLISLLAILAANYRFSVTEKEQNRLNSQIYQQVVSYLQAHCQDISLETLSKKFALNKTYMSRIITDGSGKSYKELLQDLRLEQATELLSRSREPVRDIAHAVGYRNVSYFYQLFQAKYHLTPSDYRTRFGSPNS